MKNIKKLCVLRLIIILIGLNSCNNSVNNHQMMSNEKSNIKLCKILTIMLVGLAKCYNASDVELHNIENFCPTPYIKSPNFWIDENLWCYNDGKEYNYDYILCKFNIQEPKFDYNNEQICKNIEPKTNKNIKIEKMIRNNNCLEYQGTNCIKRLVNYHDGSIYDNACLASINGCKRTLFKMIDWFPKLKFANCTDKNLNLLEINNLPEPLSGYEIDKKSSLRDRFSIAKKLIIDYQLEDYSGFNWIRKAHFGNLPILHLLISTGHKVDYIKKYEDDEDVKKNEDIFLKYLAQYKHMKDRILKSAKYCENERSLCFITWTYLNDIFGKQEISK